MSNSLALSASTLHDDVPARAPLIPGASTDAVRDYLEKIGHFPLLMAEEEIELAKGIEVGLFAREQLDDASDYSDSTIAELQLLVREGKDANARFMRSNLKLVVSVAKRYSGRGHSMMDLIQEGNLGLDRAVKKFDYTKGYKFSTYAMWWIRQAIARSIADSGHLIRIPVHTAEKINKIHRLKREITIALGREPSEAELADEAELSCAELRRLIGVDREPLSLHAPVGDESNSEFGDLIVDASLPPISEIVATTMRHTAVYALVGELPERESKILRLRYGMNGDAPLSLGHVGALLGISPERVRQLEARAFAQLRCPELRSYL